MMSLTSPVPVTEASTQKPELDSLKHGNSSLRIWIWSLVFWIAWSLALALMWIGMGPVSYHGMIAAGLVLALAMPGLYILQPPRKPCPEQATSASSLASPSLEDQLRQSQKMEVVGRLAGGVAHDFNNLLTVIQGYGELLQHELNGNGRAREMVEEIMKAGERASALTRQLLYFSRKQVPQPTVVDANVLLANLEKMVSRLLSEDIKVVMRQEPGPMPVKIDPGQLEQVILNLVVNARDAMPVGGVLTLSTRQCRGKGGDQVVLTVRDTGQGMTEEVKVRLFEPFFTTKVPGKGTGLGLATARGIVEQFSGHMEVRSRPGEGAEFAIVLPLTKETFSKMEIPVPLPPPRQAQETILLVEDEEGVRKLAHTVLATKGYHVVEARNGQEALDACQKHPSAIDLVITDVVMPGMSGVELATALQILHPGLRTLYMSGYNESTVLRHGLQEATMVCLQKPFTPDDLTEAVQDMLETRS